MPKSYIATVKEIPELSIAEPYYNYILVSCVVVCVFLFFTLHQLFDSSGSVVIHRENTKSRWTPFHKRNKQEETNILKITTKTEESRMTHNKPYYRVIHGHLNAVISERVALQFEPCQDPKLAANATLSKLKLLGPSGKVYNIGDKVYVLATLFDSYGRQKTSGGDQVRAIISSPSLNASAPGAVFDHKNGSYTIILEALWSGAAQISATVDYTREAITGLYRLMKEEECIKNISAKYKSGLEEEDVICHPGRKLLLTMYTDVCNLTDINSGMPWYCGKPRNNGLKCSNWMLVRGDLPKAQVSKNPCENMLLNGSRHHRLIKETVSVFIKGFRRSNDSRVVDFYQPATSCLRYNTTSLWFRKYTTGFFFKGKWRLRHCKELTQPDFGHCLRNRTLYLYGDSTVRQWYSYITENYKCIQVTEPWTDKKWKKPSICRCFDKNVTVTYAIHSQPFHVGQKWRERTFTLISIPRRLEMIRDDEDAIVVINIYLHMVSYYQRYYKIKMQKIRAGVESLLKRNKKVKIFIKMPHAHLDCNIYSSGRINDFFGSVFTRITIDAFKGLYDRVIVLDNKDATMSARSRPIHPNDVIVGSMINQMLSYVCE